MMNKFCIVSVIIVCITACNMRERIRKDVLFVSRDMTYECPLNGVIEWYAQSYYRLPKNMKEVNDFFYREWDIDSSSHSYTRFYMDYFKKNKPRYAYYADSVFIFDPVDSTGYRVDGHPLYWLEHPEHFPEDRPGYWENFRPAAYYKDGLISRSFDYEKYKIWTRKKIDAICRYKRKTDELTVLAGVDKPYEISPEDTALIQRLAAVKDTVRMFMKENPDIYSYVFPMQLSEKGNPWRFRFFEERARRHAEESTKSE